VFCDVIKHFRRRSKRRTSGLEANEKTIGWQGAMICAGLDQVHLGLVGGYSVCLEQSIRQSKAAETLRDAMDDGCVLGLQEEPEIRLSS